MQTYESAQVLIWYGGLIDKSKTVLSSFVLMEWEAWCFCVLRKLVSLREFLKVGHIWDRCWKLGHLDIFQRRSFQLGLSWTIWDVWSPYFTNKYHNVSSNEEFVPRWDIHNLRKTMTEHHSQHQFNTSKLMFWQDGTYPLFFTDKMRLDPVHYFWIMNFMVRYFLNMNI